MHKQDSEIIWSSSKQWPTCFFISNTKRAIKKLNFDPSLYERGRVNFSFVVQVNAHGQSALSRFSNKVLQPRIHLLRRQNYSWAMKNAVLFYSLLPLKLTLSMDWLWKKIMNNNFVGY